MFEKIEITNMIHYFVNMNLTPIKNNEEVFQMIKNGNFILNTKKGATYNKSIIDVLDNSMATVCYAVVSTYNLPRYTYY